MTGKVKCRRVLPAKGLLAAVGSCGSGVADGRKSVTCRENNNYYQRALT